MAWYRVWYEVRVPVVRYQYLVEVNEEDAEKAATEARTIADREFWNENRPEPDIDLEEESGTFYSYKIEDESTSFQGIRPTDPEFSKTIYANDVIVPAEESK